MFMNERALMQRVNQTIIELLGTTYQIICWEERAFDGKATHCAVTALRSVF